MGEPTAAPPTLTAPDPPAADMSLIELIPEAEPLPPAHEVPRRRRGVYERARRLAWWTIAYLASVVAALYLVLGSSTALRAAWLETIFSAVSPVVFLLGGEIARRRPDRRFPFGYYRWMSIAFLCAAIALFGLGIYLVIDAMTKILTSRDVPPAELGVLQVGRVEIWVGWPVLLALAWAAIPSWFIGRAQLLRARLLHDKVLSTEALMREADWLTSAAAAVGVIGTAMGWPVLDPAAAAVIALNVLHGGARELRHALADLADSSPTSLEGRFEDLPERVRDQLLALPWVGEAEVRLREQGRLIFGEARIVPRSDHDLTRNIATALEHVCQLDWRLQSLAIMPVLRLDEDRVFGLLGAPPVEPSRRG